MVLSLADYIGAHAFALLAVLAGVLVVALLVLVLVGGWVVAHRAALWQQLSRAWGRLARRPVPFAAHLARLTPRKYLALHLLLGFVLAAGLLAFFGLADEMQERAGLVQFDLALAESLHRHATPRAVWWMEQLTAFGSGPRMTLLALLCFVLLYRYRQHLLAFGWAVAVAGGGALNSALKAFYRRPRPVLEDPFVHARFWSFPSGHSMGTFVFTGMLVYFVVLFVRRPGVRILAAAVGLVWTLLIGFSRIYLGAHYFSDVVAGYAAGTVWLAACISGLELIRRRARLDESARAVPPPPPQLVPRAPLPASPHRPPPGPRPRA
ncbi:MAG TPA: phosphatase PAP2 family protein [Gemmatimonadales bacterium]|nr:phosphatase PAP2 family protein [Gemmatimonadales bacterium]